MQKEEIVISEGLRLRPLCLADVDFIFHCNTPSVRATFITFETRERATQWVTETLQEIERGEKLEFVLECTKKGEIGLIGVNDLQTTPDIGLWIRDEERGKGYAKSALSTLIPWLEEHTRAIEILYRAAPTNRASLALATSVGFSLSPSSDTEEARLSLQLRRPAQRKDVSATSPSTTVSKGY